MHVLYYIIYYLPSGKKTVMFINTVLHQVRLPCYHKKFIVKRPGYVSRPGAQIFKDRRLFFSFYRQKRIFKGKSYPENVINVFDGTLVIFHDLVRINNRGSVSIKTQRKC
ncbi:hypothetical protein MT325_m513R [Paramecium bursaria chlorella virus MT325]|uniref:Uncharacterized protein m513R n=1 Tax=Paramecium bursaria Chlorella virus MT325 TaxID=346932 RepID=A7IUP3_PBCVM|nr:hypothetical protein MT325_m513R [Paramecium bursaria chlorella virus MT325]